MAGGPNAQVVACMECAGPATRCYEGVETDQYLCGECGARFGMDWRRGPPTEPCWPIPPEAAAAIRRHAAEARGEAPPQ